MRAVAIWTAKGGVGKTTCAVNVAAELARRGLRVLVVDLDPQASATVAFGIAQATGLLDALNGTVPLSSLIVETSVSGVSLLPGSAESARPHSSCLLRARSELEGPAPSWRLP